MRASFSKSFSVGFAVFLASVIVLGALAPLARAAEGSIGSPINDFGEDTNGNGFYDELIVTVPVVVTTPGTFYLAVQLADGSGTTWITSNGMTAYLSGSTTLGVELHGSDIRQSGIDGPYQAYIQLYSAEGNLTFLDSAQYLTHAYLARAFEPPGVAFAPPYSDSAVDLNGNGQYDLLEVTVPLEVYAPGGYIIQGTLTDPVTYQTIDIASVTEDFATGPAEVVLNYSGLAIHAQGIDGPYLVYLYATSEASLSTVASDTYMTAAYTAASFEAPPGALAPPFSDHGVDTDGNGLYNDVAVMVPLTVTATATFQVSVTLTDLAGYPYYGYASTTATLGPGSATIEVDVPTILMVAQNADGPYQEQVSLYAYDPSTEAWPNIGFGLGQTAAYTVSQFDGIPATLLPDITDRAIDRDVPADGLYDVLAVNVTVDVARAGLYVLYGSLMDPYGNFLGYDNVFVPAGTGNFSMTLNFPGTLISSGLPGSYSVSIDLMDLTDNYVMLDHAVHYTEELNPSDFVASPFAILDGYLRDAGTGEPLANTGIEAFNYRWLQEVFTTTDSTGYYALPVEEGSWVVVAEPYEVYEQALAQINVTAPTASLDFNLTAEVPQTAYVNLTLPTWGQAERDRAWIFTYDAETARQYYDWYNGNRDGYLTYQEYLDSFSWPGSVPPPLPDQSGPLFTVDAGAFDLVNGSNAFTTADVEGSIFDPRPMTGLETGAYTSPSAVLPGADHTVAVNVTYALSWNDRIYNVVLPPGFVAQSITGPSEIVASGLGTAHVTLEPPVNDSSPVTPSAWVTIDAVSVDTTPPSIASTAAHPSPGELGQPVTVSANITDDYAVSSVQVEVWDPNGASLGNVTMTEDNGTFSFSLVPDALGTYTYTVTASDPSLNLAVASGSFDVVDTTAPTLSGLSVGPDPVESSVPITFSIGAADLGGVASVSLDVWDPSDVFVGTFPMTYNAGAGLWETSQAFGPLGTYSFTMTATDASGNTATDSGTFAVQDTTPPAVSSFGATPAVAELGASVQIFAQVTDGTAVASVAVAIHDPQGGLVGNYSMSATGFLYSTTFAPADLGTYSFTITAEDTAGNVKLVSGTFSVEDTTPPTVTAAAATPNPVELGGAVQIAATVTDAGSVGTVHVEVRDPQGALVGNYTMTAGSNGAYTYGFTPSDLGTYTYTVTAADASGNVKTVAGSFAVQDTTDPTASAGSDQSVTQGTTVTFDASGSSDNDAVATYTWTFDDGGTKTLTGAHPTYTFSHAGTYAVTLTVTDPSGNTATDTMTVTVTALPPSTGTVSGTVKDAGGQAIAGATVVLLSGTTTVATVTADGQGAFTFPNVAPGTYTVRATATGYDAASTSVTVVAGQTAQAALSLSLTATPPAPFDWVPVIVVVAILGAAAVGLLWYLRRGKK